MFVYDAFNHSYLWHLWHYDNRCQQMFPEYQIIMSHILWYMPPLDALQLQLWQGV